MDADSPVLSAGPEPGGAPPRNRLMWVFFGREGLRSGWRLALYIVTVIAVGTLLRRVVLAIWKYPFAQMSPETLLVGECLGLFTVGSAALVMSRIEKRPPGAYGLPAREAFRKHFWQGALWGLAEVTVLVLLIAAWGGYSFGQLALVGPAALRWGLFWALLFALVGLFEEFAFRGYAQYTLASGVGFWPAAIILSAFFGWVHLNNPQESWPGALGAGIIGLFFCLTLRRTGNLWFAVGMHASFNWGQTFLFSVPNSGMVLEGHLSNAALHGPRWLTGGTVGPEGSVFCFLTMALLFVLFPRFYPPESRPAAAPR